MKYSHSKAMAVLYKLVKLAKNGVLMIIHIYIECKRLIDNCLNLDWSPEQICGWLNSRDLCINIR
jgi:IS30 family transposase